MSRHIDLSTQMLKEKHRSENNFTEEAENPRDGLVRFNPTLPPSGLCEFRTGGLYFNLKSDSLLTELPGT